MELLLFFWTWLLVYRSMNLSVLLGQCLSASLLFKACELTIGVPLSSVHEYMHANHDVFYCLMCIFRIICPSWPMSAHITSHQGIRTYFSAVSTGMKFCRFYFLATSVLSCMALGPCVWFSDLQTVRRVTYVFHDTEYPCWAQVSWNNIQLTVTIEVLVRTIDALGHF